MITSLIQFQCSDSTCHYQLTDEGEKCQFLHFLINTSNFNWRKSSEDITNKEKLSTAIILLSKLCAIGYLIFQVKRPDVSRAVIATDYMNQVPGRSGKTLFMDFISKFIQVKRVCGKKINIDNPFIWKDLTSQTKLLLLEDLQNNFKFDYLFPCISGDWIINRKAKRTTIIPYQHSPKIAVATSFDILGKDPSSVYRKWELPFSDYYSAEYKPIEDFGKCFFHDWDVEDWKYAYMLIADCVQLYLQYGPVSTIDIFDKDRINIEVGADFVYWADTFFANPIHLNNDILRKEVYEQFCKENTMLRKHISPAAFKQRLAKYCEARKLTFSVHYIKGVEFLTIINK